jgi:hypothetical protein
MLLKLRRTEVKSLNQELITMSPDSTIPDPADPQESVVNILNASRSVWPSKLTDTLGLALTLTSPLPSREKNRARRPGFLLAQE